MTKFSSCLITLSFFIKWQNIANFFVNLEQPRTIFLQAKTEERHFGCWYLNWCLLFPLKCQTSKRLNKFKELAIQDSAKYTFSEPNQALDPMCKLSRQVRQSRG